MRRTATALRTFGAGWSTATRRLRVLTATGFALAVALPPVVARAQPPDPYTGIDLLQPSLDGNPRSPPRFRRPGEAAPSVANQRPLLPGALAAPSRVGATPTYGSPPAFGAGNTGFDSSNTPRRKKKRQQAVTSSGAQAQAQPETTFAPVPTVSPPPLPPPPPPQTGPAKRPPPAQVHPARAAARRGASLPTPTGPAPVSNPPAEVYPLAAANRAGGALPVPPPLDADTSETPPLPTPVLRGALPLATPPPTAPPLNTLPLGLQAPRLLPLAEGDPYAPLGIRAGSFLLFPSLDLSGGYSTNPEHAPGAPGSLYGVGLAELQARSDWESHSLTADIVGSYSRYGENLIPSLNVPYFNSTIDGRIDASRYTQVFVENRFLLTTDNPGSPNLQARLAELPIDTDVGGTLGVMQQFNRLSVAVLGTFDRAQYENSLLTNGEQASNADRNFDQAAGILRVGYDLYPGIKPFVEIEADERIHDLQFDRSGLQRNSVGTSALLGGDVDLFGSLTGELAGGWVNRSYKDPTLPDISGLIDSGSLIWQATPLTTAKLTAASQIYETIVPGASGQFARDLNLEVDHAFLRALVGTLSAGYGTDNYVGSSLRDTRYFVSGGLTYKLTRELQLRGVVRQDWQTATESNFTFTATSFLLGLRLQR